MHTFTHIYSEKEGGKEKKNTLMLAKLRIAIHIVSTYLISLGEMGLKSDDNLLLQQEKKSGQHISQKIVSLGITRLPHPTLPI